ncbi:MAG: Ppx/GppA family phosphatase [Rhodospirillaceae bacterium]
MPLPFSRDWTDQHRLSVRFGVIDIGSNTIRLVVYDRNCRSPVPIFNEKVTCALGRGVEAGGHLNPEGVALALTNLGRFKILADAMGVERLDVLATAALRDARDGPDFVARAREHLGLKIIVISGEEEARLSALGVLSAIPDADGIVADLGGGSLELAVVERGSPGLRVTLPLGALRLIEATGDRPALVGKLVDQHLERLGWLKPLRRKRLYLVGGSWRAMARLHMKPSPPAPPYPLLVIHNYALPGAQAADFASYVGRLNKASLDRFTVMPRRRSDTLPYAALVLEGLIRVLEPVTVVFSSFGLREGHLYDLLPPEQQRLDPLISACEDLADHLRRFGTGEILTAWTDGLFAGEDMAALRLRRVSCLLSDLSWAEHPDYRAVHAFERVLRMPVVSVTHNERAVLAVTIFVRYGGRVDDAVVLLLRDHRLITDGQIARAEILGLALRLAHSLTGGVTALLNRIGLRLAADRLELLLPADMAGLRGDVVERRLDALALALNREGVIPVRPWPCPGPNQRPGAFGNH